jgi:hypothetical protein
MAEQRSFARLSVALSAIVVAVCAVVVTVEALAGGIPVKPQRVLDPTATAQQVADQAMRSGQGTDLKADCPVSIPLVVGAKFKCELLKGADHVADSTVTIVDDQGQLSASAA